MNINTNYSMQQPNISMKGAYANTVEKIINGTSVTEKELQDAIATLPIKKMSEELKKKLLPSQDVYINVGAITDEADKALVKKVSAFLDEYGLLPTRENLRKYYKSFYHSKITK